MPGRCDVLACAIYCVARAQEGRSSEKNNQAGESDSELLAHKQPFSRGCAIRDLTIMKNRVRQGGVQDGMARPSPCRSRPAMSHSANIGTTAVDYDSQKVEIATLCISNWVFFDGTVLTFSSIWLVSCVILHSLRTLRSPRNSAMPTQG